MASVVVLDASAILAVLRKERGADIVAPILSGAMVSAVNYSEVLKKTVEVGGLLEMARMVMKQCELHVVDFDAEHAARAAALYPQTSGHGLSFADRACLSLGLLRKAVVMTTEERFGNLGLGLEVRVIRRRM